MLSWGRAISYFLYYSWYNAELIPGAKWSILWIENKRMKVNDRLYFIYSYILKYHLLSFGQIFLCIKPSQGAALSCWHCNDIPEAPPCTRQQGLILWCHKHTLPMATASRWPMSLLAGIMDFSSYFNYRK